MDGTKPLGTSKRLDFTSQWGIPFLPSWKWKIPLNERKLILEGPIFTSMIVGRKVKKLRKNPSSKKMRFIRLSEKVRNGITSSPKKHLQTFQVQVDWPNLPTVKGATKRCYQFSSKTWTIPNGYPLGFNISTVKHKNPVGKELHLFFQFLDGLFCFVFAIFCFPAKTWLSQ